MCGYELINKEIDLDDTDYIAVYGSLMNGLNPEHQPDFLRHLNYIGRVLIPGRLYKVKGGSYPYPALILDSEPEGRLLHPSRRSESSEMRKEERKDDAVVGELYRVRDATVFEQLDSWEGYDASNRKDSPYVRRLVRMLEPEVDAWVYVGNHDDKSDEISERSWRQIVAAEASELTGMPYESESDTESKDKF